MKKLWIIAISIIALTLTACNNNDQAMDNNMNDNNDTVSSLRTDTDSENYPHTQPIKTQEARYEFRTIIGKNQQGQQGQNSQQGNMQYNQGAQQAPSGQANNNPQQQQQQTETQNNQGAQPQAEKQPAQTETQQNNKGNQNMSAFVSEVIKLTNAERQKQGLSPLQGYPDLNNVADAKAKDMNAKEYFSHTSPTYGSPFDMMRDFGITYTSAAENIAQGQPTPEEVVNAWMNSEGHRANILDGNFTHIGVGYEKSGHQWVQMFIKK
ncbi:CAP domain-containing protein [Radiobacillus sp. PE A8.2]|uniref:CAP domain-containing protein n=1 Tax=Radiobacillus sp. PE A8.2 TaxID=3380349 RepID=UPI00388EC63C